MGGIKNKLSKLSKLNNKVPLWLKGNVRRKSDKGIVGAGDYDPSVSPDGLPAPFTQREPNVPAHALSIHSKSPLFYTLIATGILFVLAILAISIKLSFSNATGEVEGADDTAIATLNNVDILQAGTGQSVTIKGETLNENNYGTDNVTRRTILNNNVVRYSADYNVTKVGQITFSITLPANNTIDEATIAESQGCLPNLSKLEPADITNDDGTITKSYTNNKATCVRNITNTGSTSWQITAYLWGANNTKIQPTLAVSGETSTVRPEEISVVGRGDYGVEIGTTERSLANNEGVQISFNVRLYANVKNVTDGALGISPIVNGSWSMDFDISGMPDGFQLDAVSSVMSNLTSSRPDLPYSVIYLGRASGTQMNNLVKVSVADAATATQRCPTAFQNDAALDDTKCYFSGFIVDAHIPTNELTDTPAEYSVTALPLDVDVDGGAISVDVDNPTLVYSLSNRGSGNSQIWASWQIGSDSFIPTGWRDFWSPDQPVYVGEDVKLGTWLQINAVPGQSEATNLDYCVTWNPSTTKLTSSFQRSPELSGTYRGIILADYGVEYGIIGDDTATLPSSSKLSCGIYKNDSRNVVNSDSEAGRAFFDTLEEANAYARERGLAVNAVRLWSARTLANFRDGKMTDAGVVFTHDTVKNVTTNYPAQFYSSATSDQWDTRHSGGDSDNPFAYSPLLTPGLLSHTLTAIPSSTNPGKEDHITITTKTYNKDTDSKITINLPKA